MTRLMTFLPLLLTTVCADPPLSYMQIQPLFFNGASDAGTPQLPPSYFSASPRQNITRYGEPPQEMTLNLPGLSPFLISNPYGFYMPPVVVINKADSPSITKPPTTTTAKTTKKSTKRPRRFEAPPGMSHRFFDKSLWRKPPPEPLE